MLRRRIAFSLALALALALTGCPGNDPPRTDGGHGDGGPPGVDANVDTGVLPHDAGPPVDGSVPTMITHCPGESATPLASGVCEVTGTGAGLLIQGDILAPDQVYRGGQVFVDGTGAITCVACDCSATAGAAAATHVTCPHGVVSPGLINAHEHLTYEGLPYTATAERYEHRNDWRTGHNGHTHIGSMMATADNTRWAELRMVLGGATSINGSGGQTGFLRNLDRGTMEGLGHTAVDYNTFPLGDSNGVEIASGCDGYSTSRTASSDIATDTSFTPHIAEGIAPASRNEFLCQSTGMYDLIQPQTALIHGVALLPIDMQGMAADGSMLIWSPRSNITLYGDTAHVVEYDRMGVPIAMGTDWVFTGSMNMLRELQCADEMNSTYLGHHFTDEQLWRMATYNGAVATATDDSIGSIVVGHVADLSIFDGSMHVDHRAVIDAAATDVALVLRGGVPLYGESAVVAGISSGGTACDTIDVCGQMRRACVMREVGVTLAALTTSNASQYPLFFCTTPMNEPTCRPERDATGSLPSPVVMGSNSYTGMTSATDTDGDGIANAMDNCPDVFNAIRPLDMGAQADSDMDGVGDSCDPCPLDASTSTCGTVDPNDRDHDMVNDSIDNCPGVANMNQLDTDHDGHGDLCDPCPMDANPGTAACPVSIYSIQHGTTAAGAHVSIHGVVSAVGVNGFYLQVETTDAGYMGADYSGVYIYTSTAPTVTAGQTVMVSGTVAVYMAETEITGPTITPMATGTIPTPVMVTPAEIATGGARARALEGVLAQVSAVTVTDIAPTPGTGDTAPTYEFAVTSMLRVDDMLYRIAPFPAVGESFATITGIVGARYGNSRLMPRTVDDYVGGTPTLVAFGPALSFTRVGATAAPTFPMPLTVQLARASSAAATVMLSSGDPTSLTVPATVTIPAGASSAPVLVTGLAQAASVTITATLGAPLTSHVRVLGAAESPTSFMLTPATATIATGGMQLFTLVLDIPAPTGGQMFTIADTTGGTVPASVTIPADGISSSFPFMAGGTAIMGTLTASAFSMMQSSAITITAGPPGHLVINEIDYDQPGTDGPEFVEIYNGSSAPIDLTNVAVVLVNGNNNLEYGRVMLTGMLASHAYLIAAPMAAVLTLPAGTVRANFPTAAGAIQNGSPDGVALYDTVAGTLLDALSYEGPMTAVTISGHTFSLVEGTALPTAVQDTGDGSLSRIPNGSDSNDAASDWMAVGTSTPGTSNDGSM